MVARHGGWGCAERWGAERLRAGRAAALGLLAEEAEIRERLDALQGLLARSDLSYEEGRQTDLRVMAIEKTLVSLKALRGRVERITSRIEWAEEIRSQGGAPGPYRWEDAIEGIRNSPRYGGLVIEPQLGLVPIGPDPDSGCWEFAVQGSGRLTV